MPPKKNIVKSGNAGTSSKGQGSAKPTDPKNNTGSGASNNTGGAGSGSGDNTPKPLFPPGSKTPVSLLYER